MKRLIIFLASFLIVFSAKALDKDLIETRWHTASGKSYTILEAEELTPQIKQKIKSKIFVITYVQDGQNQKDIKKDMADILAHFYHFILNPQYKTKKDLQTRKVLVTIRAAQTNTFFDKNKFKAHIKTQKLGDIALKTKYFYRGENHKRFLALKNYHRNKGAQSFKLFSHIKKKTPVDYLYMGKIWLWSKDPQKSKTVLAEGVKAFPNNRDLLLQLTESIFYSGTYVMDGKYEYDPEVVKEAKKTAEQVLKIKPDDYLAQSHIATIETALGNFDAAEKIYKTLISKSKKPSFLNRRLGELYTFSKKYDNAKLAYEESLKLQPNEPATLNKMGELLHFQEKYNDALKFYTEAENYLGKQPRKPSSQSNKELVQKIKENKELAKLKKPILKNDL